MFLRFISNGTLQSRSVSISNTEYNQRKTDTDPTKQNLKQKITSSFFSRAFKWSKTIVASLHVKRFGVNNVFAPPSKVTKNYLSRASDHRIARAECHWASHLILRRSSALRFFSFIHSKNDVLSDSEVISMPGNLSNYDTEVSFEKLTAKKTSKNDLNDVIYARWQDFIHNSNQKLNMKYYTILSSVSKMFRIARRFAVVITI